MAIALSGVATGNSGTAQPTSIPISLPGTAVAGNVAVIVLSTASGAATLTDPAGWTIHANGDGGNAKLGFWSKTLDAADIAAGGVTVTRSVGSAWSWECATYSGTIGPDALSAQQLTGTGTTSITIPAVTPVAANCLRLAVCAARVVATGSTATFTEPAGWTEVGEGCDSHATNQRRASFLDSIQLVGQAGTPQATATATASQNVTYQSYSLTLAPVTSVPATVTPATVTATATVGAPTVTITGGGIAGFAMGFLNAAPFGERLVAPEAPALFVGLNNTGPEKGAVPGTYGVDYRYDSQASLDYLAALGCPVLRVMVRWERIQPTLGGALDATELTRLTDYVTRVGTAGMQVILVINKGGRYNELAIGEAGGPTQAQFTDLWSRLSAVFRANATVVGYGNNEPHDFPDSFASYVNVAAFDVSQENWTSEAGSGVTTARSTAVVHDGSGSLLCQKTVTGGIFQSLRVTDNNTTTHNESALGHDYACWVFCPAGETGWFAQIDITDSAGTNIAGSAQALTPGTWTYIVETFTPNQVSAMQRKIVQIHNAAPTAGSKTFYVDSIVQAIRYTGLQRWQDADKAAVAAIRAAGDAKVWYAAGYGWAAADGWSARNGAPWHTAAGVVYEAHLYYDDDHSGTYPASYATENAAAITQGFASAAGRALSWLGDFLGWLDTYGVFGLLGETGWPSDANWNTVGSAVLAAADAAQVSTLVWAVGEIEGSGYPLTPWYASGGVGTTINSANLQSTVILPYFGFVPPVPPPTPPPPSPDVLAAPAAPIVEIGFTTDPLVGGGVYGHWSDPGRGLWDTLGFWAPDEVWTDVTPWLQSFSYTRGATRVEGPVLRYEAGTATVVLNNTDGRFHPLNLSGPYASAGRTQVRPMVPIRIRATYKGEVYDLWRGFVDPDGWDITYNLTGDGSTATVSATDAQMMFGAQSRVARPAPVGNGELSGARVTRILNSVGWPATDRSVEAGESALTGTTLDGDPWTELLLVQDTELGEIYVDATSKVVFKGRHAVLTDPVSTTPQAIFGRFGLTGELPHAGLVPNSGGADIRNVVRIAREGGTQQEARDQASITDYWEKTHERTDLLMQTDTDAANYAQYLLSLSAQPDYRFAQIVVDPRAAPAELFPLVFATDFGWRYTIRSRPPIVGLIERDVLVRGIAGEYGGTNRWRFTWSLQPAARYTGGVWGGGAWGTSVWVY